MSEPTASVSVRKIGKHVAFVPAHCSVSRRARKELRRWLAANPCDFVYGDSLHHTDDKFEEPIQVLRPGWSPERLRGHCYVGDVVVASHEVAAKAGGPSVLLAMSTHERALALSEHAASPARAPLFLYTASFEHRFPSVDLAAVIRHCKRSGIDAECILNTDGSGVHIRRKVYGTPGVCVIVPTRGTTATVWGEEKVLAAHAISSLVSTSTHQNFNFIAVVDADTAPEAIAAIKSAAPDRVTFVHYDRPFNFAEKINEAAVRTDAEYLLLLNDDTEALSPHLLSTMLSYFSDPTVAMVGPTLLYEDGSIQSAGHFFNPVPYDYYRKAPGNTAGAYNMLRVTREVSSVIAACALTRRETFFAVGGLSALFPGNYNDIDYALKLQMQGLRVLCTPFAECYHFESKTREPVMKPIDVANLGARWRDKLENDPYAHPGLQRYQPVWKSNRPGQRSVDEAMGPTAPIASK